MMQPEVGVKSRICTQACDWEAGVLIFPINFSLDVCRTQCFTEAFLLLALCFFRDLLPEMGST